jgi:hypothetical protein
VNENLQKCAHSLSLAYELVRPRAYINPGTDELIFVNFNCCLSVHVDNYTIIIPTKCASFLLLKAQDITICTFCLCILSPYMFRPTWDIFRGRNVSA